ncbi:MAG: ABC transporter ATP-binding protein, partial [Myxococcales bacterium]|nr:ABC transporter ATP-binding protein [Myxococcales bacterium]
MRRAFDLIWPSVRPDLTWYAMALLAAPLSAGLTVVQPWLLRKALDEGVDSGDLDLLVWASTGYLVGAVLSFVFEGGYNWVTAIGASRTVARLRSRVFRHALSLGASFYDREPTGRLLSRVTSDVDALAETITAGAVTLVLDLLLIAGLGGLLVWMDPWLSLVLLTVAPPLAVVLELIRRRMRVVFVAVRTHLAEMLAYAAERITGVEVVQLYAAEEASLRAFDARLGRYRDATVWTNVWDALMFAVVDATTAVTMAMMLAYGASERFGDAATVGLLAAFVDGVGKLFGPIRELSNKVSVLQRAAAAVDKLGDLLDNQERVPDGTTDLPDEVGDVVFDDLTFGYVDGADVLKGVSFSIRPGEVVALVGRTGSGKSTVGKLLLRAYGGYRGRLHIDGTELSEVRHASLRSRIGVVQQDVVLFPDTVRFNLAMGEPIPDDRLWEALGRAQADDVVRRLGGLDARIEHGGRNLSIGEGQLLAFARVLCRDTPLVVLDEATASVDSLTERRIQDATHALLRERTVLVVAH